MRDATDLLLYLISPLVFLGVPGSAVLWMTFDDLEAQIIARTKFYHIALLNVGLGFLAGCLLWLAALCLVVVIYRKINETWPQDGLRG